MDGAGAGAGGPRPPRGDLVAGRIGAGELEDKLDRLPARPGVYLYKDAKGQIIYVGKAASLKSRVRSYFQESRAPDPKTDALVGQIRDFEYIVTSNELEALILESNLVKKHRPRYNIILRDDKHYPFLKLTTNEEYPRLVVARRVQQDGAAYFGPFYPATAMRETLRLVRQLFPLRTCRIKIDGKRSRPCLQYYIHRCNAPCTGWESREGYAGTVADVERFLEGKNDGLAQELTMQMESAENLTARPCPARHAALAQGSDVRAGGSPRGLNSSTATHGGAPARSPQPSRSAGPAAWQARSRRRPLQPAPAAPTAVAAAGRRTTPIP